MKNKIFTLALTLMGSTFLFAQQWTGTNNTTSDISRSGKVSVGTTSATDELNLSGAMSIIYSSTKNASIFFKTQNATTFEVGARPYSYPGSLLSSAFYIGVKNVFTGVVSYKLTMAGDKIGIGTENMFCADCADYRLFVKDGIRTEKIKVDIAANNGWADYVFEPDYKLMPLTEVEQFIKQNGHLPEVPTTAQAIANGIELKEMNILLLKKVEELTLYSIELQKRIEALEGKTTK